MTTSKWATFFSVLIFLSGLGTVPAAQEKPARAGARKPDAERIVGTWRITKSQFDGKELAADVAALARLTFTKDGKASMRVLDKGSEGKYELVGPGKIDVALDAAKTPGLGIYKFDGDDRLTLCVPKDAQAKERPTEFTGAKDSGQVLLALTRAKPGEEKPSADEVAKLAGPVDKIREAATRQMSVNNLKQIGLAMHNYHDTYGALPLHAIYSKDGKTPLLSWRVAILPYIEETPLYNDFKLDQPWDSEHNKKLIARMPKIYAIGIGKKGDGLTYYQVFTGPDTVFDGTKKVKLQAIANGISNTLLAVEAKEPVIWTKPVDLTLPKDTEKLPPLGGIFSNGFHVLMCDGSVRMMAPDVDPKVLRHAISPKGGE